MMIVAVGFGFLKRCSGVYLADLLPLFGIQRILLWLAAAQPPAGLLKNEDRKTTRPLR
jgi:hypothetical protein